jgi:hypothetical protein
MSNYGDLVKVKQHGNLYIHKYKRKVFYDNLWHVDPALLDARGLVLDEDGDIVQLPFTKIFNYKENGTTIDPSHTVIAVRKVNGFMACVSLHKGEVLVSTTGSLDSDYVAMAKELLPLEKLKRIMEHNYSYCFEIVHSSDPHIIKEKVGAYAIGARAKHFGSEQVPQFFLNVFADKIGVMRPDYFSCTFADLVKHVKTVKHEGYVVYDLQSRTVLKIKSPYYLVTKFLARSKKLGALIFNGKAYKNCVDEEFYPLCEWLQDTYSAQEFIAMPEQERIAVIRNFFEELDDATY